MMEVKSKLYKSKYSNPVMAGDSSKLKYFYIEKKRQELHRLLNFYGGSVNHIEILELAREFDNALIELYQSK